MQRVLSSRRRFEKSCKSHLAVVMWHCGQCLGGDEMSPTVPLGSVPAEMLACTIAAQRLHGSRSHRHVRAKHLVAPSTLENCTVWSELQELKGLVGSCATCVNEMFLPSLVSPAGENETVDPKILLPLILRIAGP